ARGGRIGVDELQTVRDPVEAVLDGRVTDPEGALHLLDGAVAAHEGGDEHLILDAELGELRKLEGALDSDARVRQSHPLDDERLPPGQFCEFLPVHPASLTFLSMTLIFLNRQDL